MNGFIEWTIEYLCEDCVEAHVDGLCLCLF